MGVRTRVAAAGDGDPAPAAAVRPGQAAGILVGIASRSPGFWRVPAFTVRYHVGGAHYQATFDEGIGIRVTSA